MLKKMFCVDLYVRP